MPDFGKYSNYTEQSAFSGVVFGAQAPVLEVELNEMQEIFNHKLKLLSALMGDSILVPADGSISYDIDSMELSLVNCIVASGSVITAIPSAAVVMSPDNTIAYLRLTEKVVTSTDTLTEYGKVDGPTIENPIIDTRVGVETSRRKVITYALECADILPQNVPGSDTVFVKVGELAAIEADEHGNPVAPGTMGFSATNIVNNLVETLTAIEQKVTEVVENTTTGNSGMTVQHSYENGRLSLRFLHTGDAKTLPLATKTSPGLMMVGEGLDVDQQGKVSTNVTTQTEAVTAQIAENAMSPADVNGVFESLGVDPTPDDPND